jgi:glutamate-ammonia-ligase adenylyltransferase
MAFPNRGPRAVSTDPAGLPIWITALQSSADPDRARQALQSLAATDAREALLTAGPEFAANLIALLAGSKALGDLLIAHPDWLELLTPKTLAQPRQEAGLRQEAQRLAATGRAQQDFAGAFNALRNFQQRELLRIAGRDFTHRSDAASITRELSDVADVCLSAVLDLCRAQLEARYGQPWHQDADGQWSPTKFCVLGLGKLGGQELNYSSDVDVIFLYTEEGNVFREPPAKSKKPAPGMTNHQFFARLAEAFVGEVTRFTPQGTLYRVDLRLRPEGDTGPLVRSLPSCENYYAQWGQTWERMMLIKGRGVAGDRPLAGEFLETINPFRYPRSLNRGVLQEVAAIKDRIENEIVGAGELERNVKLGRGGIREIEFIAQSLQLLHAGRNPFLQNPQTLPTLAKLAQYNLLPETDAQALTAAYLFLRDVEHRLQMDENRQTHTIPTGKPAQERLARLMGCAKLKEFEALRRRHTDAVRTVYDRLLRPGGKEAPVPGTLPTEFAGAEAEWKRLLAEHWFRDVDKAFRVVREFVEGPGFVHVSARTQQLALNLLPRFFALCRKGHLPPDEIHLPPKTLSDPDRVVTRLDSFISAYGARATLFELWTTNPSLFELLLLLFDRSEFLAETAIRVPDLVDELVLSDRLRLRKSAADILRDLRHGLADTDQSLWLRRYHQAEQMRIGLRDILGLADPEHCLTELSALADACLQYALEVTLRKHKVKGASLVIIGLGKLGGAEIDYGSDLDVVFVARTGEKNLPRWQKLAVEVLDLLSRRTEAGLLFQTDARLRPDGEKGLLVTTLDAYEDYYRRRALLWEIQALSRNRPVAGDDALGADFQRLAATLTDFRPASIAAEGRTALPRRPAAFTPDWRQQIQKMRLRIEKERTPPGKDDLAIKTGRGGLMDAEFLAQALCLEHGWQEPNTLRAVERAQAAGVLPEAVRFLAAYRHLRRVEGILRRWSYEGETVLPDDPAPFYRVAVRCGFATPEAFRTALSGWRAELRAAWQRWLGGATTLNAPAL